MTPLNILLASPPFFTPCTGFDRGWNMGPEVKTSQKTFILLDFWGCGTLLKDFTIFFLETFYLGYVYKYN